MSWDVSIVNFSKEYKSVDEIPESEQPLPLGTRSEVHDCILEFFPNTDLRDPTWGLFSSKFGSIEFKIGKEDPSISLMLHVRASNEINPPIIELCKKNKWSAIDCRSGEFLEYSENPSKGLEDSRAYLNQVLNNA